MKKKNKASQILCVSAILFLTSLWQMTPLNAQSSSQTFQKNQLLSLAETAQLPHSTVLRIRFKNGHDAYGEFMGITTLPLYEYQAIYDTCRKYIKKKINLPALHESIALKYSHNQIVYCEFLGFDYQTIRVRYLDEPEPTLVPWNRIIGFSADSGYLIEREIVYTLNKKGEIPYRTVLLFNREDADHSARIGLEQIEQIQFIGDGFRFRKELLTRTAFFVFPILTTVLVGTNL